jgi:hypothetical protein
MFQQPCGHKMYIRAVVPPPPPATFAETLQDRQHSTQVIPKSHSHTLSANCKNLGIQMIEYFITIKLQSIATTIF